MAIRVLMILLAIIIVINVVILLLSAITGKNIYSAYGKQILKGFSIFLLLVIAFYVALSLLGLN